MVIHLFRKGSKKCVKYLTFSDNQRRHLVNAAIKKVLIANRGEIACRVAKTAQRLGIQVVAVYSDADANSLHVSLADEAHNIGPAASSESYLRSDKLLNVAKSRGCQAVHPGYGFLSENADFADLCTEAGITFIGPPASAIRDMGSKSTSKKIMEAAGVPVVKGYHGEDQSDERLLEEADKIGYPVMLKAVKGGGGKGMRVVQNKGEFFEQLASARNEAMKAFGDTVMLVEAFVTHPRHVEVQVFGDLHGNYVHLHERDCSVQRRHQKIIEEAPAPGLPDEVRTSLGQAAVRAAQAVGYVGAGTVEFILDADTYKHYFMEMNTRLQVEHPVTEMITNTDLVEWQFKVAAGEMLPLQQKDIKSSGHAFEARIYAEDPDNGFLPQAGTLKHLRLPTLGPDVRVDTGVVAGDPVSVFYDPLIAKLVVRGENRTQALNTLHSSLTNFQVTGLPTNVNFLLALSRHPEFQAGKVHTNFISRHSDDLLQCLRPSRRHISAAVAAQLHSETKTNSAGDAFQAHPGFRVNHNYIRIIKLQWKDEEITVEVEYNRDGSKKLRLPGGDESILKVKCKQQEDGSVVLGNTIDGQTDRVTATVADDIIQVFTSQGVVTFQVPEPKWKKEILKGGDEVTSSNQAASPMPGVVDQVLVSPGDKVTKGQPLVTVIAMKMEYVVRAPTEGTVAAVLNKPGDAVAKGSILVNFQEESNESAVKASS